MQTWHVGSLSGKTVLLEYGSDAIGRFNSGGVQKVYDETHPRAKWVSPLAPWL
jgi:hypothetical protein